MTLKFEVGKKYITRNGTVVVCLDTEAPGLKKLIFRFEECDDDVVPIFQAHEDGSKYRNTPDSLDIISEHRERRVVWVNINQEGNPTAANITGEKSPYGEWIKCVEVFEDENI